MEVLRKTAICHLMALIYLCGIQSVLEGPSAAGSIFQSRRVAFEEGLVQKIIMFD